MSMTNGLYKLVLELMTYNRVIVIGPQRSGTRIATKILAHELKYEYVDETEFAADQYDMFKGIVRNKDKIVVQAPGLTHRVLQLDKLSNTATVFMVRPTVDIIMSQRRIHWPDAGELAKYNHETTTGVISVIKFQEYGKLLPKLKQSYTLQYEDLVGHPLFIPKEKRKGFAWNQTTLEG